MQKKVLFQKILSPLITFCNKPNKLTTAFIEMLQPVYKNHVNNFEIKFYCPNYTTLWRAQTLLTKEPDTIKWIDEFLEGEILFDVGANIGVYSLYAAKKGIKVFAFEPESQNYAVLNRNVYLNQLQENLKAYNIALNNENKMDNLQIKQFTIGGALNNFGEHLDYNKNEFQPDFQQGAIAFSLDHLIETFRLAIPHHIKIDVDGLESEVINGAKNLLGNLKLKSVLIELNTHLEKDMNIIETFLNNGFELVSKFHAPIFDRSEFSNVYNFIFKRKELSQDTMA